MTLKNSVLALGAGILLASCTNKSIPTQNETDDMYATSADAAVSPMAVLQKQKQLPVNPSQTVPYDDEYDPMPESNAEGTEDYFSDDYITSRDYKRNPSSKPGYSDGYSDGYSQGWTDYAWNNQPLGFNSPFNRFSYSPYGFNSFYGYGSSMFFSYSPYNSWNRWGSYYSPWASSYYGGFYDPWGYSAFSPWGYRSMYYNSWYSPYNSWGYSPYDSWGYYGNGYSPYYNYQSVIANNAYQKGTRTFGTRSSGRNTGTYNDKFTNTRRPSDNVSSGRSSNPVIARNSGNTNSNGTRVLSDRRGGTTANSGGSVTQGTKSRTTQAYDPSARRTSTYDSYSSEKSSRSNGYSYSGSNSGRSYSGSERSSSSGTFDRSSSGNYGSSRSGSYSSGSSTRSSDYSSGSSSRSSGYSSGSSSSSSRGSYSSGSSGSSSSSSGSSGRSSGGSSSGGGSSRGPR